MPDLAAVPAVGTPVPAAIRPFVGRDAEPIWRNVLGGLTFASRDLVAKWNPAGNGIDLAAEAQRLDWVGERHPVPRVVAVGADETGAWLVTERMPHLCNAVAAGIDGGTAARALGAGLRRLHDALPVEGCPFAWRAEDRPGFARLGRSTPPIDCLVVAHGDACVPNTLVDRAGRFAGTVDVGALGVADRWADLAVASMSLGWNFAGAACEHEFWAAYGIEPDAERVAFYRDLWNAE